MSLQPSSPDATIVSPSDAMVRPLASPAESDASCRSVLSLLIFTSALWLVFASLLGLLASLKFHAPNMLANYPWTTFGRIQPAHQNAFLYGFAIPAGLAVALWIFCRLGRTVLAFGGVAVAGALLWNVGVATGVAGILLGDNTGYEGLEIPSYASPILLVAFCLLGFCAVATFHNRRELELYPSQWFLFAALFWFAWIFSTAHTVVASQSISGLAQACVAFWYSNNLRLIVLGALGIGAIFYFIPKLIGAPLHSRALAIFAFWTLLFFGSWAGIPAGTPLPAWVGAWSGMAAILLILPILAVAVNFHMTAHASLEARRGSPPLRFILFAASAFVVATTLGILAQLRPMSDVLRFTFFEQGHIRLFLYGFFAMAMFGAIYHILPRLTLQEGRGGILGHFWLSAVGIICLFLSLAVGGAVQGFALNDPDVTFLNALFDTIIFFRISTLGELLMLAASLLFLLNITGQFYRCFRACCCPPSGKLPRKERR